VTFTVEKQSLFYWAFQNIEVSAVGGDANTNNAPTFVGPFVNAETPNPLLCTGSLYLGALDASSATTAANTALLHGANIALLLNQVAPNLRQLHIIRENRKRDVTQQVAVQNEDHLFGSDS
jgi:hypothetical protein